MMPAAWPGRDAYSLHRATLDTGLFSARYVGSSSPKLRPLRSISGAIHKKVSRHSIYVSEATLAHRAPIRTVCL